ncbi:MAG: transposase [Saprospiraceae bacterium]
MANTYTQLGIHIITAVKHREAIIHRDWLSEIYAVSATIVQERKHTVLAIGGEPDHLHFFIDLHRSDSIADLVGAWKAQVSGFISKRYDVPFEFQRGYGAFAVSKKDWPTVKRYINNQYEHHNGLPFKDEYIKLLDENEIPYDDEYLFMWIDED